MRAGKILSTPKTCQFILCSSVIMLTKKSSEEGNNIYETIDTNTTENVEVHPEADAISDKHTKGSEENKQIDSEEPTNGGSDISIPISGLHPASMPM